MTSEQAADDPTPRPLMRSDDPNTGPSWVRGSGCWLWDSEGRRYLDLVASYGSLLWGHAHPKLVAAAQQQSAQLAHLTGMATELRRRLCAKLAAMHPMAHGNANHSSPCKAWLVTTGARAVELAMKLALHRKPGRILHFDRGFHGRSIATGAISDTRWLKQLPTVPHGSIPFPGCRRCAWGHLITNCQTADCLKSWVAANEPLLDDVSAVIVEPIPGAKGYLTAADSLFRDLRRLADQRGWWLIADEVQTGLGRTGNLLTCQAQGWIPDLICVGKSLGGGIVPIAAVLGPAASMDELPAGVESETFGGGPLACRVALTVLELLEETPWKVWSEAAGAGVRSVMADAAKALPFPTAIEGMGAFGVLEVQEESSERSRELAWRLTCEARKAGVLFHWSGPNGNRLVALPPLVTPPHAWDWMQERLQKGWHTPRWTTNWPPSRADRRH
ncbi:MAG: aspartate aminotransferase family protein [Pirellulaceae bacterium]